MSSTTDSPPLAYSAVSLRSSSENEGEGEADTEGEGEGENDGDELADVLLLKLIAALGLTDAGALLDTDNECAAVSEALTDADDERAAVADALSDADDDDVSVGVLVCEPVGVDE